MAIFQQTLPASVRFGPPAPQENRGTPATDRRPYLVTDPPRIENGHLIMPTKPGWGADINEDAVKRHPPM